MLLDILAKNLATQIVGHVEWAAGLCRHLGIAFPREYDFGVAIDWHNPSRSQPAPSLTLKLRVNDARYSHRMIAPGWNDDAGADYVRAAGAVVATYLDLHPDIMPSKEAAAQLVDAMRRQDDEQILAAADAAATSAKYEAR